MDISSQNSSSVFWSWNLVLWIVITQIIFYGGFILWNGFEEQHWRVCVRLSARLAVLLFSLAFIASSVHSVFKNSLTYWLRFNRKYIGISFAITHLLHLAFLVVLQFNFHPVFELAKQTSLLGGGLAYVFVVLMLFTSFPKFEQSISRKNWKLLHTIGGYWIWFIFFRSYLKKGLAGHYEFWPFVVLLVLVIILRFYKLLKQKSIF